MRRGLTAVGLALALVAGAAGCRPAKPLVVVYGDSLVWEAGAEIRQWAAARGYRAEIRQRFGGAPCSLFDEMREDRARRPASSSAGANNFRRRDPPRAHGDKTYQER